MGRCWWRTRYATNLGYEDRLTAVVKSLLNTVIDAWTDPKYIRYALYSQQFGA